MTTFFYMYLFRDHRRALRDMLFRNSKYGQWNLEQKCETFRCVALSCVVSSSNLLHVYLKIV